MKKFIVAAQGHRASLQSKGKANSAHVQMVWFDTVPEYLLNWPAILIGQGILPCILAESS
jgi:hypothetical protein